MREELVCQENFGPTYGGQSGDHPETKRYAGSRTDSILCTVEMILVTEDVWGDFCITIQITPSNRLMFIDIMKIGGIPVPVEIALDVMIMH